MRKIYTSLLALAMTMVSMVANAQYKAEFTTDPVEGWTAGYVNLDPVELATALATDTATLHAAFNAISKENAESFFYLKTADGKTNAYTGNAGEFWMNMEGAPVAYGDEAKWFFGIFWEPAGSDAESGTTWSDSIYISFGQMPNTFKNIYTPSVLKATTYLVVGDKEVSIEVIQNINAAPEPTLPAPETTLSKLNIVKEYTFELPFTVGKSYEGKTYSATFDGIYEALGVSQAELDAVVADYVYTQVVAADTIKNEIGEPTGEFIYSLADKVEKPEVAAAGAWYGRYINYDEASDSEVPLTINAPMAWGAGHNTFYTQSITLAEGVYSIISGQYPDKLVAGDTDYAYHYIIAGDKAVKVKIQVKVTEPEKVDQDKMTLVGESSVDVTAKIDNNYATKGFTIDMEEIVTALGCTIADLADVYAYDQEGKFSDNHTESSGGFYYNADGKIENWGSNSAAFIARTSTSLEDGKFTIGQMSNAFFANITEDTTVKLPLIFQNVDKYWVVTVNYTVQAPKADTGDGEEPKFNKVASDGIAIQIVPSADTYAWGTTTQLDLEYIEKKIGTTDFTVLTDKYVAPSEEGGEPTFEFDTNYTCTPAPGFWYGRTVYTNSEGQNIVTNAGWGTNSFGITYADGVITWYQFPGQSSAGEEWAANLYLMNEETGDYMQYVLNVQYVTEVVPEAEVVIKEDVEITVKEDLYNEDGLIVYNIPTDSIYNALGLTAELLESATFLVAKSSFAYAAVEMEEGALFNKDGFAISEDDIEEVNVLANFSTAEGLQLVIDPMQLTFEKGNEDCAVIRFAIEYDGKRAQIIYSFFSEESPLTGIEETTTSAAAPVEFFNAAGIKVAAPQKGLNIIKMSDGSTKKVLY